eukprot:Seg1973.1 transcript_id=Seg1973.1/GoldUCD/mRNA.D3Y31 product="hypothetical protein" protein_id=Seg1973.1/GoldUCD/D3Y31
MVATSIKVIICYIGNSQIAIVFLKFGGQILVADEEKSPASFEKDAQEQEDEVKDPSEEGETETEDEESDTENELKDPNENKETEVQDTSEIEDAPVEQEASAGEKLFRFG